MTNNKENITIVKPKSLSRKNSELDIENPLSIQSPSKRRRRGLLGVFPRFRNISGTSIDSVDEREEKREEMMTFEEFLGLGVSRQESCRQSKRKRKMRANVVTEIVETERSYVKNLKEILEGYRQPALSNENFTHAQIDRIFGNLAQLYSVQKDFLAQLESAFVKDKPQNSNIGAVFTSHGKLLEKEYVKYCRNYGDAIVELARMDTLEVFSTFWENCRKSRNLPLLKLADFLLQPVQRICKYPLHFTELLKYTEVYHGDYQSCQSADLIMRDLAQVVNDQRRETKQSELSNIENWTVEASSSPSKKAQSRVLFSCDVKKGLDSRRLILIPGKILLCKIEEKTNLIFDEQIDVNHLSVSFSEDSLQVELNCHFKKYTHDVTLALSDEKSFSQLRSEIQLELKFANPTALDNCHQVLPLLEKAKPAARNSMYVSRTGPAERVVVQLALTFRSWKVRAAPLSEAPDHQAVSLVKSAQFAREVEFVEAKIPQGRG
ncbi:Oidioi.mRNA.OKI2018_I69.XSR.g13941.t1.cds [Oikopleura dioica]|uniref:Oidioi.mRNA.OKI2018_I69.XSR.g13941.t1.cds n=1 Tax=Oikopleura dioica TaxID=34765 RepID=A0ABN7SC56_OIKDI|nr:Oidioi.mRNA.OKI2018_I69.XSR.g13941.t1.cds [Oikopleura dioica]